MHYPKSHSILLCFLVVFLCACKTKQIPVITTDPDIHKTDSVHVIREYIHDSIFTDRWHEIQIKNDTVYIHDSVSVGYLQIIKKHDTISFIRIDTLHAEPVIIEKQAGKMNNFLRNSGIAFWILIIITIAVCLTGLFVKFAK